MTETHRLLPGAEPYHHDAGSLGAVVLHGFAGSPASSRPLAEWLGQRGLSTIAPRLPGHGTHWEDLLAVSPADWENEAAGALTDLHARCPDVVLVGISFGGALALHLAATRPDRVRAVALVNPWVHEPRLALAPVVRVFTRTVKIRTNDINRPGQDEVGYERAPVKTLGDVGKFLRRVESELPEVTQPLVVFRSDQDHLISNTNSDLVARKASSTEKDVVALANSFHVATLDHDADLVRERILAFARAHATASTEG